MALNGNLNRLTPLHGTITRASGGGGGTTDYTELSNKPSINSVELTGNKTAAQLGLATPSDIPSVPVQSVNGKTGAVVLTASDVGAGTYSKPSDGIPKTDLASSVQTSLEKADTAYQKPSGGIPASDLAIGVIPNVPTKVSDLTNDSGFVNAAGAATAAPVQSVNGQTGAVTVQAATDAQVTTAVDAWLDENVAQETGYVLDSSLTMSNAAAPADKVGDLKSALDEINDVVGNINVDVYGKSLNIPLTDVIEKKYMGTNGNVVNNNAMCYGFIDASGYESIVIDTTGFSDTVIINACDNSKAFSRNIVSWGAANKYVVSLNSGESYFCISCNIVDKNELSVYSEDVASSIIYRLADTETEIEVLDKSIISSSNEERVNFFESPHLVNAYISPSYVFKTSANDRSAWVKLPQNTLFNISVAKKPNKDMAVALYNAEPVNNSVGTEYYYANSAATSFNTTFRTDSEYTYLAIKYWTTSATTYTEQEVLDSIKISVTNGMITDEIKALVENARHIPNGTVEPLALLHFSDLHADKLALKRISAGINSLGDLIQDAICTGDIVGNTNEQIAAWWNESILTCIGNHDTATYSGGAYNWTALSMADRDAYYIAPFEANWGITHTAGTSYYYKDYTTQKVRLIVLDVMLYKDNGAEATAQTAWLENLLADAITNNLHVLIAIHTAHGGATAEECSFSKYNQGAMPTNSDCNTPQTVIDAVASAIGNGLHFIGYLVGHTHQDNIWDAENDGSQLMYCVTCASTVVAQWRNSDQYRGEFADAYNLVVIDTANTLVKVIRCGGADIDDHMRTRKAICFDYSTGQKVGEVL